MMDEQDVGCPVSVGMLTGDPLRLEGMRELLEGDGQYRVVTLTEADSRDSGGPRLAVLDVSAVLDLPSLLRQFRRGRPNVAVLVLGPVVDAERMMEMIAEGAKGYLQYTASGEEIRMALGVVRDGSIWAPRKVLAGLLADREDTPRRRPVLTPREQEVLHLLVQGRPNRAIAAALKLDEATVKAHLGRLMRKLGVRNRTALSMAALAAKDVDE